MPYIKQDDRKQLDTAVRGLMWALRNGGTTENIDGRINYAFTRILKDLYDADKPSYYNMNKAIGVLECIKLEFYRRITAPYEDKKIEENGDL